MSRPATVPIASFNQDLATTAITTAAYTQLVASLSSDVSAVTVSNTSAVMLGIYYGAAGAEQLAFVTAPASHLPYPIMLNKGVRVSAKSLSSGNGSTGTLVANFFG